MNTESCNCIIEILLKQPFALHSNESKENIITDGRPMPPSLTITSVAQKCVRHLAAKLYDEVPWLTGCKLSETLFCWPCLLFSSGTNVWTTTGFSDWSNMNKSIIKHGKQSHDHLSCVLMLTKFSSGEQIETLFDGQYNINISKHNEMVKKNRQIMKIMIDVVCYLGTQEWFFRSHFEDSGSHNRGNYVELIQMLVKHNIELKDHLETSSPDCPVLSNDVQNDLIECISSIFSNKIKLEISEATFVALICDELTDSTNKSHMSHLLRYVDVNGNVQERFIRFQEVSENRCATLLFDKVFKLITAFNFTHKLICQSYNGAAIMSGEINGLQKRIRDIFPEAIYIHCFGHRLNLVLSNSCSRIAECKHFFESLTGFPSYFANSTERANAFDALINEKLQRVFPTRWNHNGILLLTIFDHRQELIQFFNNIIYIDTGKWDIDSVLNARGLMHLLNDFDFVFLLTVFSRIFPETDVLHNMLQSKHMDIIYCLTKIEDFIATIEILRKKFDSIWEIANSKCNPSQKRKMRCTMGGGEHEITFYYKRLYIEIIDNIIEEITRRFESLNSIKFLQLVNSSKFLIFSNTFPLQLVHSIKTVYPSIFNINYLKTELLALYKDTEFKNKSVKEILDYILKCNLEKNFVEITKLLKLILTIPATIASAEQNFSTLKRIKCYLKNARASDRLNDLAIISIENQKLKSMLTNPEVYEDIIDEFAKKNRQVELNYKMYN